LHVEQFKFSLFSQSGVAKESFLLEDNFGENKHSLILELWLSIFKGANMDLTLLCRSGVNRSDSLSDNSPKVNGGESGEIESTEFSLEWLTLSSMLRSGTDSFTTTLLASSLISSS